MQVSAYNFFTPGTGGGVVYNAAEGTFTRLDCDTYESLRRKQVPDLSPEHLQTLTEAGVLHKGQQTAAIQGRFELGRFGRSHINITLAPTIECNLACWYCYQNERRHFGIMDAATEEATLDFIAAATAGKESFNVDWFGGEPLLAAPLIERMTNRIRERSGEGAARYTGGLIITNGLLFDDAKVAMLQRAGIGRAQVSIDRLVHKPPTKRGLLMEEGGAPSPILANILKYKSTLHFHIRINLSDMPEGEFAAIEAALARFGVRDLAYTARVEDNVAECSKPGRVQPMDSGLTRKAFAKAKAGFAPGTQARLDTMSAQLTPKRHFCGATNGTLYVIDHRGDVSRCFFSAGVGDESIGNVRDIAALTSETPNAVERKWRDYKPFDFESCASCRVLPLCQGGCSHARVLHDAIRPPCESIKFNINTYVREISTGLMAMPT